MAIINTDLFELIKALEPAEKAYFKRYAYKQQSSQTTNLDANSKQNPYLQLFDAIDKQTAYDEAKLLTKFAKQNFAKQFSVAKNYLYNLILDCLCEYDSNRSNYTKTITLFLQANALERRELSKHAVKKLDNARKAALESDLQPFAAQISYDAYKQTPVTQIDERTELITAARLNALQFAEEMTLNDLNNEIFRMQAETGLHLRNEEMTARLSTILNHPLLSAPPTNLSFGAQLLYHQIYMQAYYMQQQHQLVYQHARQRLDLFLNDANKQKQRPTDYFVSLDSVLISLLSDGSQLAEFDVLIEQFHNLQQQHAEVPFPKKLQRLAFSRYYQFRLVRYVNTYEMDKALPYAAEVISRLNEYNFQPSMAILFRFNAACVFFYNGKYPEALDAVLEIINDKQAEQAADNYAFAKILFLLIHFELGNDLLLENAARSTYRFLQGRQRLFKTEGLILKFIRKAIDQPDFKPTTPLYKELHDELKALLQAEPSEQRALTYFEFMYYLESKIQGVPLPRYFEQLRNQLGQQKN